MRALSGGAEQVADAADGDYFGLAVLLPVKPGQNLPVPALEDARA